MSDIQKEAAKGYLISSIYPELSKFFNELPDRFDFMDVMKRLGLKNAVGQRIKLAHVLRSGFKCETTANGTWKKPCQR